MLQPYDSSLQWLQLTIVFCNSYNRYISVASRVVRRSLKEEKRIQAERRGQMDLRFAKWEVSSPDTRNNGWIGGMNKG